jgi:hypothetical protein
MIEEATSENIEALNLPEDDLALENRGSAAEDEENLSYMEEPDDQLGLDALRSVRLSSSESTNPAVLDEELPDRVVEDEDADPVGNGRD